MQTQTEPATSRGEWKPDSWQTRPASQQPVYPDADALRRVLKQLARLPPLVTSWEIENLKHQLAQATEGERFLLQGGDCSESFADCESSAIASKLKILLQMSLVLVQGGKRRVIRIGRFAGQYAKPRSADSETRSGVTLPSFRGDMIDRAEFTAPDRAPDPDLLLRAYERSGLTINFVRALIEGGFADLTTPNIGTWASSRNRPTRQITREWFRASGNPFVLWKPSPVVCWLISTEWTFSRVTKDCTFTMSRLKHGRFHAGLVVQLVDTFSLDRRADPCLGWSACRIFPGYCQSHWGQDRAFRHSR